MYAGLKPRTVPLYPPPAMVGSGVVYACSVSFYFFKLIKFIYLFRAVLGFIAARGLSLVAVRGLLIEVASLVVEHGL